ncbi:DMT family transporter [Paenibacillus gansuensis]|uniref:DMT family transporter n=1 Tax=Paenibacillus gansuensis TaxID=306542 RepID=A0ABW5PI85_9BACL
MKGILFAILAGAFITLQGVANARIGEALGSWQAAALTQGTGFVAAVLILLLVKDRKWKHFGEVKPVYLFGGAFAALVIYSNITAMHRVGATLTVAAVLIAQIGVTLWLERKGWFGPEKTAIRLPHLAGIGLMILGVVLLA